MPGCDVLNSKFRPIDVQRREPVFKDIPTNPLAPFQCFVPEKLVEEWVNKTTNSTVEDLPSKNDHALQSRLTRWTPTTVAEVYTFIAIVISMENHCENAIENYWRTPDDVDSSPIYPFTRHMSLRRFQALFRQLHVFKDGDVMPLALVAPFMGQK